MTVFHSNLALFTCSLHTHKSITEVIFMLYCSHLQSVLLLALQVWSLSLVIIKILGNIQCAVIHSKTELLTLA